MYRAIDACVRTGEALHGQLGVTASQMEGPVTRNLVIVRSGRGSLHPNWLHGAEPTFDLLVTAYEEGTPTVPSSPGIREILLPGRKVAGYHRLFTESPDLLRNYDQIALFDDDIDCDAIAINHLFSEGKRYSLQLYQPSLTWDSYVSYGIFLRNPLTRLRFVNFIEMMCPVFSASMLSRALPLFSASFEVGIDLFWCRLLEEARYKFAVIDTVSVRHTRAVEQNRAAHGFTGETPDYQTVVDKMQLRTGVTFTGPVAYAAVLRNGWRVEGRLKMTAISLATLFSTRKPKDSKWYYRPIVDHIRHNLTRPIGNEPINLDAVLKSLSNP
jgi:hypothetical protein